MYREETTRDSAFKNRSFFLVIGLVLIVLILTMISNYLRTVLLISYTEFAVIAILVVLAALVIRNTLTRYAYTYDAGELRFFRLTGRKEKLQMTIKLKDIQYFGALAKCPRGKYISNKFMQTKPETPMCITYAVGKRMGRIVFDPSEKLQGIIQNNLPKKKQG